MAALAAAPEILRADCSPPEHHCHTLQHRAFRHGLPLLVVHRHGERVSIRLYAHRPNELTPATRRHVLGIFETAAQTGLLDVGARVSVHGALAEFRNVPTPAAETIVNSLLSIAEFRRVAL